VNHPTKAPRWLVAFVVTLVLSAGTAVAAWAVDLPYVAWSPGPVARAFDAIIVEEDLEVFPPAGDLLVLTIVSQPRINIYELLIAVFDPTVDIYDRALVRREGETEEEYRTRQLGLMDTAVQDALTVAFDRLGIDPGEVRFRIETVFGEFPASAVLEPGDFVLAVEGVPIESIEVIREQLVGKAPGEIVVLVIERDGEQLTVQVELGETVDDDTGERRTIIGIGIGPFVDPPAGINTNNIGGPSAGMMYTLALIDLLSAGDLTKGHMVAGTGTIDTDGLVGGIGGVRQKVVAAEAAGARYLLVPESNYEAALTAPRGDIVIVSVATIDDALDFLESLDPA
jgi:Lon-like protease